MALERALELIEEWQQSPNAQAFAAKLGVSIEEAYALYTAAQKVTYADRMSRREVSARKREVERGNVTLSIRVSPDTMEEFLQLAESKNLSKGKMLELLVSEFGA